MTALILAGSRTHGDPVAQALGVPNKVLGFVHGLPMIARVLLTLGECALIHRRYVCGLAQDLVKTNSDLDSFLECSADRVRWVSPGGSPSLSVGKFLAEYPDELPLLVTTGDHVLLTSEMVEYFIQEAKKEHADMAVGVVPSSLVASTYPQSKRTVIRFQGGGICGCNLFALFSPRVKRLAEYWAQLEKERKNPLRLIRNLGGITVLRYLSGRLSLAEALDQVGQRLDLTIREVVLPFPDAAVDVDTLEDLELVGTVLQKRSDNS